MTFWNVGGDDASDARHDDPRWAERYYPEHRNTDPLPATAQVPDTIPQWMLDQD